MKIAFFGTPDFSVPTLNSIINSDHEIVCVITQPDKPVGRKKILTPPPVKQFALLHNLKVLQPENIKDNIFFEEYKKFSPDINLIIAFGQIFPEHLIFFPKYNSINIHASLLPKYRGASPINFTIINGEKETGITYQFIEKKLDAGDIIYQEKMPVDITDTSITLSKKLSDLSSKTILKVLDMIEKNNYIRIKQDEEKATYTKILKKEDGKINFNDTSLNIYNKIRGLLPWPVAFCYLDNKRLKIFKSEILHINTPGKPGEIIDVIKNKGFVVKTQDSSLLITEVQLEGSKKLSAWNFSLGYNLKNKILN